MAAKKDIPDYIQVWVDVFGRLELANGAPHDHVVEIVTYKRMKK